MEMRLIFILLMLILCSSMVYANVIINEIMYNPNQCSDSYCEWVEVYNTGPSDIDLSGWQLCSKDLLKGYLNYSDKKIYRDTTYILSVGRYALITDGGSGTQVYDNFPVNLSALAFHINGAVMCSSSGLANSGDTINLSDGIYSDIITYNNSWGANGNGRSLEYFNNSWQQSLVLGGTPGSENNISQENQTPLQEKINIVLKTYLDEIIYTNIKYTKLFRIEIKDKDDCSLKDTITVYYNITNPNLIKEGEFTKEVGCSSYASTGELTPITQGNYTLCGTIISSSIDETYFSDNSACMNFTVINPFNIPCNIKINITTDKEIYKEGESIKFRNNLNNKTFPFKIEYWIEDFFGNIYKKKYNTTNTNQKSWKTNIAEQDRVLFIKSVVYSFCNDSNITDNYAEKMLIVKSDSNEPAQDSEESNLEIIEVDEKARFGEVLNVKVGIYKGNTNKYSISLHVEDKGKKASEITKIHMYDKYSSYKGQLSIQLKPNCNLKLKDGKYDIILKGLDKEDRKEIKIEGLTSALCKEIKTECVEECPEESVSEEFEEQIEPTYLESEDYTENIISKEEITGSMIYESKEIKAKRSGIFFFCLVLILVIAYFIFGKKEKKI